MIRVEISDRQLKIFNVEEGIEIYPKGPLAGAVTDVVMSFRPGEPCNVNLVLDPESINIDSYSWTMLHRAEDGKVHQMRYSRHEGVPKEPPVSPVPPAPAAAEEPAAPTLDVVVNKVAIEAAQEVERSIMGRKSVAEPVTERTLGDMSDLD